MDSADLPVILIEVVLIFGGTLAFGWWQLRSVRRDRERAAQDRAAEAARPADVPVMPPSAAQGSAATSPLSGP